MINLTTMNKNITFRDIEPSDTPLLFAAYASTRAEEMKLVPWDDAQRGAFLNQQFSAQQSYYQNKYPDAEHFIIEADGEPVAMSHVNENAEELRIVDLIVLPEHRGGRIGTRLVTDLCTRAEVVNKPLRVYVDNFSPALQFFERLGFSPIALEGASVLLEWSPQKGPTNRVAQETSAS